MDRVFFSVTEMEQIAARIGLPLDDATREATRATVEGWLNDANDLREEMEKPEYNGVFQLSSYPWKRGGEQKP